jgi:beta-galactosidase
MAVASLIPRLSPLAHKGAAASGASAPVRLDTGWKFLREDAPSGFSPGMDDAAWEPATLPHTARIEALVTGPVGTPEAQWQGICWYRRRLQLEPGQEGSKTLLRFEGAMNVADVWLDGEHVANHLGGYLPFVIDLTGRLQPGRDHLLAVRLDNRDNAVTGPKPMEQLDYHLYHGLYRPVYLVYKDRLHITDPMLANRPAGGGIFVRYPRVSRASADVLVEVHVRNEHETAREFRVRLTLKAHDGRKVGTTTSSLSTLEPGGDMTVPTSLVVASPRLWSPAEPNLYLLDCEVLSGARVVDLETVRIGIRRIEVTRDGFTLNGERLFLRGANRHQEYPYIGYAVSDAAQYRDARKVKEAGFDYIRLSHYPHAPAFMDACDELGLVVMDCIPGWQFFNPDPAFVELQYQNCRDLVRRDRNHPCVILWEVSLNESAMPAEFVARTHAIAHEEYPGDQCFTAGWMHGYDVFIDARQHGGCRAEKNQPCLVSEYGDWEYYAMNAGLDQTAWQNLSPAESNSRQLRWQGERAQLQQATNFQEAHNDNRATIAFADGLWVMYDYNRGYAPDIESSGCMDLFRLPKYSAHLFRSQRDPTERVGTAISGPMVFIASEWTPASATEVRVFSNCDEVSLSLNGRLLERKGPDRNRISTRLAHPPFTFQVGDFQAGALRAQGYLAGRRVAEHVVRTPGAAERLTLAFDLSGRPHDRGRKDHLFCYASLVDAQGTVVPEAWENVAFGLTGDGKLIGMNPIATDAGIASIVIETIAGESPLAVHALAIVAGGGSSRAVSASRGLAGRAAPHQVRASRGGFELLVRGRVVTRLERGAAKFRVPISAPPDKRDPFRR